MRGALIVSGGGGSRGLRETTLSNEHLCFN